MRDESARDETVGVLRGTGWADHALLDSGGGRKLERYGPHTVIRPEPQAMWSPANPDWRADAEFVPGADEDGGGRWVVDSPLPDQWPIAWEELTVTARPTPFRHLSFFPDMMPIWCWARARTRAGDQALNLFGYTGVGSLALAARGAQVVHVDASKKSVAAARDNAALSGLHDAPVRWIVDDAVKFVAREGRRGRRYDGIILDPPKYGRGPDGEVWRLEEDLRPLLDGVAALLDPGSRYCVLTVYAVRLSALALAETMRQAFAALGGEVEALELALVEEARDLTLPTAIVARWTGDER